MAQRIRNSTKSTNIETINCDSYLPTLLNPRTKQQNNSRKCTSDRSNSSTGAIAPASLKTRPHSIRQQNLQVKTGNVLQKELAPDSSALVEVTVRTHANKRLQSNTNLLKRQPWGKLLKTDEHVSSFSGFNPLRTLHFLISELHSKMKNSTSGDPTILDMVNEIQYALNRIPSDTISKLRLHEDSQLKWHNDEKRDKKFAQKQIEHPEKLVQVIKASNNNKSCQTVFNQEISNVNLDPFKKQLESNTIKLEASCMQMEIACNRLKKEKEQVELLLNTEKSTVQFLRKQIEEAMEKAATKNSEFERLIQDNNDLHRQVEKLQKQIDSDISEELKTRIQELEMSKSKTEQDNLSLRHKLALCSMEKEKYFAILAVRDRQISDIQTEMTQLQEVVNEQLLELQKSPFGSSPSSQSTFISNMIGASSDQVKANETGDANAVHNFSHVIPSGDCNQNLRIAKMKR